MRVSIDIQAAVAQRAGVGRYVHSLVPELLPLAAGDDLSAFYFDFRRNGSPFPGTGLSERACRWLPGALVQQAWKRVGFPPYTWFADRAEVYHFPNYVIPPIARRAKTITTIHDVGYLIVPETLEPKNLEYLRHHIGKTVQRADAILTPSQVIADQICEHYGLPADRVVATHLAPVNEFEVPTEQRIQEARVKHGLDRPYLLHVGTLEPRKNHRFLLEVFERLEAFDGDLVLCGMRGWKNEEFEARLEASPARDRILFPDYVSDADLPALYAGASAFLFPSLYEGFGLPPIEAMRCGCPVVSSPGGSLAEVVKPGGIVVDAFDADAWADAIMPLIADPEARERQIAAGLAHAETFHWSRTAEKTWEVYRKVGGT